MTPEGFGWNVGEQDCCLDFSCEVLRFACLLSGPWGVAWKEDVAGIQGGWRKTDVGWWGQPPHSLCSCCWPWEPQLRVVALVLIYSHISFSNSGLFSRVLRAIKNKPSSRSLFRKHGNMVSRHVNQFGDGTVAALNRFIIQHRREEQRRRWVLLVSAVMLTTA